MRRLIADLYKIVFHLTGSKIFSLFLAIGYITVLNLLTLYGLSILLEDWLHKLHYIHKLFSFPYYLATVAVMLSLNFWLMLPLHKLSEEIEIRPTYRTIIIYTLISAVLYAYTLLIHHVL
jgi:hypothetical protein